MPWVMMLLYLLFVVVAAVVGVVMFRESISVRHVVWTCPIRYGIRVVPLSVVQVPVV